MNKKKFGIDDFDFICPMNWDDMLETNNSGVHQGKTGKFCEQCKQVVLDVTDCSLEEVAIMQQKDPHLCVAIKTIASAGVALSLAACSSQVTPPPLRVTAGVPRPVSVPQAPSSKQHATIQRITREGKSPSCAVNKNTVKKK